MDFPKVVELAWVKSHMGPESSSSSGNSGNESDNDYRRDKAGRNVATYKNEAAISTIDEVPPAVQNVLDKIELAQLERAKKVCVGEKNSVSVVEQGLLMDEGGQICAAFHNRFSTWTPAQFCSPPEDYISGEMGVIPTSAGN